LNWLKILLCNFFSCVFPHSFFFKKTKTGSNRPVSLRFGFLGQKLAQTGLAWFFGLAQFLSGLARFFFPVFSGLGSVRFFRFQAYKTETEPNWSVFSKF